MKNKFFSFVGSGAFWAKVSANSLVASLSQINWRMVGVAIGACGLGVGAATHYSLANFSMPEAKSTAIDMVALTAEIEGGITNVIPRTIKEQLDEIYKKEGERYHNLKDELMSAIHSSNILNKTQFESDMRTLTNNVKSYREELNDMQQIQIVDFDPVMAEFKNSYSKVKESYNELVDLINKNQITIAGEFRRLGDEIEENHQEMTGPRYLTGFSYSMDEPAKESEEESIQQYVDKNYSDVIEGYEKRIKTETEKSAAALVKVGQLEKQLTKIKTSLATATERANFYSADLTELSKVLDSKGCRVIKTTEPVSLVCTKDLVHNNELAQMTELARSYAEDLEEVLEVLKGKGCTVDTKEHPVKIECSEIGSEG